MLVLVLQLQMLLKPFGLSARKWLPRPWNAVVDIWTTTVVLGEKSFKHAFVDHVVRYVEGRIYTNGMENYWGQLDRMMHGTYTYALPHHLFRYTDELTYRFNHRDGTDLTRFLHAMQQVSGKRLTYDKLTTEHLKYILPKTE